MPSLAEVRQQYPQYADMSDADFAGAFHKKYYADMPRAEFDAKMGIQAPQVDQSYKGAFLPLSKDAEGNVSFDSNAGIVGAVKRGVSMPGDVLTGKVPMYDDNGRISEELIGRSAETASIASPVSPGSRGAISIAKPAPVPSAEALKKAGKAGFDAVRDSGVTYRASAVDDFARTLQSKLESEGLAPELSGKTFSIIGKLQNPPEGSIGHIGGLITARRSLGRAAKDFTNPDEQFAATLAIQEIDNFIMAADPKAVLSGPAGLAARVQEEATANYAASKRSGRLTGAGESAELRAAATNSGQNLDNAIRQRAAAIVDPTKPKNAAGFSAEEVAAVRQVAEGTATRNAIRHVGNLLGGGGGMGQAITSMGGAAGGGAVAGLPGAVAGAALPVVGMAARATANRGTKRALAAADELTRSRSPMAERMAQNPSYSKILPGTRSAVGRTGAAEAAAINPADMPKAQRNALMRGILTDKSLSAKDRRELIDLLNGDQI